MSSYVPGAIGSILQVNETNDSLFSNVPSDRLKAKVQVQPLATEPRKRSNSHDDSSKPKRRKREDKPSKEEHEEDQEPEEKEQSASEAEADDKADRTVFIGNLPLRAHASEETETEETDVKPAKLMKKLEKAVGKELSKYGVVESVRLRSIGVKSVKVPTGSDFRVVRKVAVAKGSLDERVETCNAYVVYEKPESVAKAVEEANGMNFMGNHIRVDSVNDGGQGKVFDRKRSVFVGNLTFESSEEDCWKHFANVLGDKAVKSVRIIKDPATNLGRGFAYVLLKDEDAVLEAIEKLDGTKLRKRPIRVTKCERSSAKKDAKLAAKFSEKKARRDFAGNEASDPTALPVTRRKRAVLAQKSANKKSKSKPNSKSTK